MKHSARFIVNAGRVSRVVIQEFNEQILVTLFRVFTRSYFQRGLDCAVGPF